MPLDAAARYERTLRHVQARSPFSLLVTHGFGVQAMAESCDGVDVLECEYCALTRMRRVAATTAAAADGGAEKEETAGEEAEEAQGAWNVDVLCRATHTSGLVAPPADASGTADGDAKAVPPTLFSF